MERIGRILAPHLYFLHPEHAPFSSASSSANFPPDTVTDYRHSYPNISRRHRPRQQRKFIFPIRTCPYFRHHIELFRAEAHHPFSEPPMPSFTISSRELQGDESNKMQPSSSFTALHYSIHCTTRNHKENMPLTYCQRSRLINLRAFFVYHEPTHS